MVTEQEINLRPNTEGDQIFREDQDQFCNILSKCATLRWKKLNDYGLCYDNYGSLGLMCRIGDKFSRLNTLMKHESQVKDETIEDTAMDMINYLAMFIMTKRREELK